MSNFKQYSAFYDLLYQDKDYNAEAEYICRALRAAAPDAHTILELGSGTGRHGRLLCERGFTVHGVERSAEMVALSNASGEGEAFTCEVGDIADIKIGRSFDAVISLFHVISYLATNDQLLKTFHAVADHLHPGGVFMFDVWHGPAVLTESPSRRVKEVADESYRVRREATPFTDLQAGTVKVVYDMDCEVLASGEHIQFQEEHLMRYLFTTEIDLLAKAAGFEIQTVEEFMTGAAPSSATWGVNYVLHKTSVS